MAKHKKVSLKRKHNSDQGPVEASDEAFFPHTLFLDDEDIEKLSVGSPELGNEFQFQATARVTSISSDEDEAEKRRSVTLTLVEGELEKRQTKSQAERMFGGGDGGDR